VDRLRLPVDSLEMVEVLRCMLEMDGMLVPVIVEELWYTLEVLGMRVPVDALEIVEVPRCMLEVDGLPLRVVVDEL
jgi:hypothetical protein